MSSERSAPLRESECVELKKSLAELKQGLISIVAILNKHGAGELWFGVSPDGSVVGLDVSEKILRDLSQSIGAHIEPRIYPQIELAMLDGKSCLHIAFSGKDMPYFAWGRAYMRVADEDRQLTSRELENIILHKHKEAMRWDNEPCEPETLSMEKLDAGKIRRFVELAELSWDNAENALDKLSLIRNGKLLNAVKLFFAAEPPLQLRCAVFATTSSSTIIDRHDFDGDMLELIEEAQKYILRNIHIGMRLDGLYRVDVPEISMAALREAIINAFCHRDYRDPDYVQIAVFRNRVEIRNPGGLYDGLSIEEMRRGNVSRRRNPLIAELFRRIHMVEGWGRGMPLILENAPTAQFRQTAGLFIASFERPSYGDDASQFTDYSKEVKTEETSKKPQRNPKEKLLALIKEQPELSVKAMSALCGMSINSVQHHLNALKAAGKIHHIGPTKSGRWEVLDADNADLRKAGRAGV